GARDARLGAALQEAALRRLRRARPPLPARGRRLPRARGAARGRPSRRRALPDAHPRFHEVRLQRGAVPRRRAAAGRLGMPATVFTERGDKVRLDKISTEPPKGVTKQSVQKRLDALGAELFALQDSLWGAKTNGVLVVLQGRDSAGKDGTIKHVAGCLNPRGVHVTSFGVPSAEESRHDFL